MTTQRLCFAVDLKDEPELIEEYKHYHAVGNGFPEVAAAIRDAGIEEMEIYLIANRLFMIMEVNDTFDPVSRAEKDAKNEKVQLWEKMMWKYQQQLPWAKADEKWLPMDLIFKLTEQP